MSVFRQLLISKAKGDATCICDISANNPLNSNDYLYNSANRKYWFKLNGFTQDATSGYTDAGLVFDGTNDCVTSNVNLVDGENDYTLILDANLGLKYYKFYDVFLSNNEEVGPSYPGILFRLQAANSLYMVNSTTAKRISTTTGMTHVLYISHSNSKLQFKVETRYPGGILYSSTIAESSYGIQGNTLVLGCGVTSNGAFQRYGIMTLKNMIIYNRILSNDEVVEIFNNRL